METKSDDGLPKTESKKKEEAKTCKEEEIELVDTDVDTCAIDEDFSDDFLPLDIGVTLPFSGSPILQMHERISRGASSSWWLPITEFEPDILVHASIHRSSYIFLGVSITQVYANLKSSKESGDIILARQLSTLIGREFGSLWKDSGEIDEKIELSLTMLELSLVCACVSWSVENVDQVVFAANKTFPKSDWDEHTESLKLILTGLRDSLGRVVDRLCTEAFGQTTARYHDEEIYH